ncbi:hypothetical protein MMAN_55950 [Mycobacterium mantenii]|uniref:protein-glutamate methylesterase n=1 Tax=Mycobacterium mantenii TaxID=560555 RepID=A0A1X0G4G2_MYCNT|nr:chemotaxis protein CheB [Mycobacterium mantenii]MCV7243626.1 chemotaxis protein CheB [Mycobacterium mantenii]ORB08902.1 hypothetical protein BST30_02970 [Mycobacterium mantenii]BBY41461.1 hypothetical protein MMAN_55950 [Mycobacterium mantenii]
MATDGHGPGVQLVALLASAGGLEALSTVLRDLPPDFPAAVVVQQHLGGHYSLLPAILSRQTGRSVAWAQDGSVLASGQVVVCPPGMLLQLTSEGRCRLHQAPAHRAQVFDGLLASIASSYGPKSVAVVLSGSGHDGAAGTAAMKRAGAVVIAESPETAQYSSMPIAAARAGADLVLRIDEIGAVLAGIVAGAPLPEPRESLAPVPTGDGDAAVAASDMFGQLSPKYRTNSAEARGELARLRGAELERRRQELSVGFGATRETVAAAQRKAEESRYRAQLAHQAAEEASTRRDRHVSRRETAGD